MNSSGLLTCARYAFAPNSFSYCGPDKTSTLSDYIENTLSDAGLIEIIKDFEVLFPYLQFIAYENNVRDPFSLSVVEAYWIGNKLLNNISPNMFYRYLSDNLKVKRIHKKKAAAEIFSKLDHGAIPHHSFHVFNIFRRMGHLPIDHTLETMDSCRIGWGTIKSKVIDEIIIVKTKPVVYKDGKLLLGKSVEKEIKISYKGRQLLPKVKTGDLVSYHWGMFCDRLTVQQVKNLETYTRHSLTLANLTV